MSKKYLCEICERAQNSLQGVRSHQAQSTKCCRKRVRKEAEAVVSDSDEGGGEEEAIHDWNDDVLDIYEEANFDVPYTTPEPALSSNPSKRRRVEIEEVEDDTSNDPVSMYDPPQVWKREYPESGRAGEAKREAKTTFERLREEQIGKGNSPMGPFDSLDDWEMTRWLATSGLSQKKIDEFLHLKMVRERLKLPYGNKMYFNRHLDSLPTSQVEFQCTLMKVVGDELDENGNPKVEILELWHRDPVECIREILGNPSFKDKQQYEPERVYRDPAETNRQFDEMWTADWWWEIQELLPKGATVSPVILSSDKTHLSVFSGDKQAWPVYITVGNIEKSVRRQPSSHSVVLLGYIPVSKLECFTKDHRSVQGYQVFHDCMKVMLEPLVGAGMDGVDMTCADGWIRRIFPILAAYIADYPEQCLVTCTRENSCPQCLCSPGERGSRLESILRTSDETIKVLSDQSQNLRPEEFKSMNLRPINPFWVDLPHCDIHTCITPDNLHQLHKGVFADHIMKWSRAAVVGGDQEVDRRFRTMSRHPTLRHFRKGISTISQWTGTEYKAMEKVFLGILADVTDLKVIEAVRALLDFIFYSQLESHSSESLDAMDAAWNRFHDHLPIFEKLGIRKHFNINKLHNIRHAVDNIRSRGTADGFNTENSERLHIDLSKSGYRASNRRDYTIQMTRWLSRQERVHQFTKYLQWAYPTYQPGFGEVEEEENDNEDDDEDGVEEGDNISITDNPAAQGTSYRLPKEPSYPGLAPTVITRDFGAEDFLYYVQEFMKKRDMTIFLPRLRKSTRFDAYKKVTLTLPTLQEAESEGQTDVIHASKAIAPKKDTIERTSGTPAKMSTVLVRVKPRDESKGPFYGLQAAHVRLIFRFPEVVAIVPEPLCFVQFFTPFQTLPAKGLHLFRLSHSTRLHVRHSAVVSLHDILQTCHLIPQFNENHNRTWISDRVLEQSLHFYFNPYLRRRDFYVFQHGLYMLEKKRKEDADRLAYQRLCRR